MPPVSTQRVDDPVHAIPGWIVAGLGIVVVTIGFSYVATDPDPPVPWTFEFALGVVPPIALLYAGFHAARGELAITDEWRFVRACLLGGFAAGVLALAYVVRATLVGEPRADLFVLTSAGIATGAIVGLAVAIVDRTVDRRRLAFSGPGSSEGTDPEGRDRTPTSGRTPSNARFSPEARTLAELLVDRDQRFVVTTVARSEAPVSIASLSRELAERRAMSATHVRVRLRHVVLPSLEAKGLIVTDARTETVTGGPELESLGAGVPDIRDALASIDAATDS